MENGFCTMNSSSHIKVLVGIFVFMFSFGSFSQKKIEVERFWLSANHGFNLYNEVGEQIQLFDQFLIGGNFKTFRQNVGTGVPTNPNAIFSLEPSLNRMRSNQVQ